MNSSEYLARKKREAPRLLTQSQGYSASLRTQIVRYASASVPQKATSAGGSVVLKSSDSVMATAGNVAVCCSDSIKSPTWIAGDCVELYRIAPGLPLARPNEQVLPRGYFESPKNMKCLC